MPPKEDASCPCKCVVEMQGQLNLTNLAQETQAKTFEDKLADTLEDFREMKLETRECLDNIQKATLVFQEDRFRMSAMDTKLVAMSGRITKLKDKQKYKLQEVTAEFKESLRQLELEAKESLRLSNEAYGKVEIAQAKKIKRLVVAAALLTLFVVAHHGPTAATFLSKLIH